MKGNNIGYHVDGLWKCSCGSFNAVYNTICKKCKSKKL